MVVLIWLSMSTLLVDFVAAHGESSWKIPMWADLYLRSPTDWEDIDFKLAYLMDTYDVVSLEKCLYEGSNDQNTVSMALTSNVSLCSRVLQRTRVKKSPLQINVGYKFVGNTVGHGHR